MRSPAAQVRAAAARAGFSGEVAVVRHGRLVYAQGFGYADRRTRTRPTLDTAFNLASIGKTFTGVAVAQLVQARKLSFADHVDTFLPKLPPKLRRITVGQLLDHTSGLGDFFSDPGFARRRASLTTLSAYLPLIERESPAFAPGTRWSYSNSGFVLAGLVVERVTGQRFDEYLRRHVWLPAGMTHTGCFGRTRLPQYAAVGYLPGGATNTSSLPPTGTSAGGCYASTRDLIAFVSALEDGRLLTRRLVHVLTTSKVKAPGGGYGYGFGIRYGRPRETPTVWHDGGAPGAAGELDVNTGKGVVAVVLGNVGPPQVFPVADALLDALRIP